MDISALSDASIQLLFQGSAIAADKLIADLHADKEKCLSIIQSISRKARENDEEKGLETLYIAFGMVSWKAEDGGRPYFAPVILMPIRIMQQRIAGALQIQRNGDFQFNLVLLHLLNDQYQIQFHSEALIESLQDDVNALDTVYEAIKKHCQNLKDFQLLQQMYIGNFSFQKMVMVNDLKNSALLYTHPVIAAIVGDPQGVRDLRQHESPLELRDLDLLPRHEEFLILDADSSQERVIQLVGKGLNGVIQGPPGTGKSQTIANIIATQIAKGKRVLFVAEKRAALDVVLERLKQVGLGHMVLDLHGADTSRRSIMKKLADSFEQSRSVVQSDLNAVHVTFDQKRRKLNNHVHWMHKIQPPFEKSTYDIFGHLLQLSQKVHNSIRWSEATIVQLTPQILYELHEQLLIDDRTASIFLLHASEHHQRNVPPGNFIISPWEMAGFLDDTQAQGTRQLVSEISIELQQLMMKMHRILLNLGYSVPTNLDGLRRIFADIDIMKSMLGKFDRAILDAPLEEYRRTLQPAIQSQFKHLWSMIVDSHYRSTYKSLQRQTLMKMAPKDLYVNLHQLIELVSSTKDYSLNQHDHAFYQHVDSSGILAEFDRLSKKVTQFAAIMQIEGFMYWPVATLENLLSQLEDDSAGIMSLNRLWRIEEKFARFKTQNFLTYLATHQIAQSDWVDHLYYAWYKSILDHIFRANPDIQMFSAKEHALVVQDFCVSDLRSIHGTPQRINQIHALAVYTTRNAFVEQDALVKREINKKTRHLPFRKLMTQAPDVIQAIFPCWMASPLTVSQLIPSDRTYFDLVIFDEASQVLPEDAVAAIVRGKQLVVAGDKHQLPPTQFFVDTSPDDETENEQDHSDQSVFESLLDQISSVMPYDWMLEWHYRSRDEALIAFANQEIYQNRLHTFPSPFAKGHAFRFIEIPWSPDFGQPNEMVNNEVNKVVELILEHAREQPNVSLGVITMGVKHRDRIDNQLHSQIREDPTFRDFFSPEKPERFFIKSIEQVQGDERDAIILTVGYTKDLSGKLQYHFGPINEQGGERRLNVATTRARQLMTVVASFSADDMDPKRTKSVGVKFLRDYLAYAASNGNNLPSEKQTAVAMNPFEENVYETLQRKGLMLIPQWGVGNYRLDFAVQHPQEPGRFLLAIECDGATYHSSATARDRDRLRQQQLENLGWSFHRIWSTEWFHRNEHAVAAVMDAYDRALRDDAVAKDTSKRIAHMQRIDDSVLRTKPQQRSSRPHIELMPKISDYSSADFISLMRWIQSDGKLYTDEELIELMTKELGFKRSGAQIERILSSTIQSMNVQ